MFDLSGKVAVVTGCNTGLGQGMALALAQAGCDIVGLNIVPADETAAAVRTDGATVPGYPRRPEHRQGRRTWSRARRRRSGASTSW